MNINRSDMRYRPLGKTGIDISVLSFGAGPVSTLMVGDDGQQQRSVIKAAIETGVNWFDTAATYGGGQSESSLGNALTELGAHDQVHVATKVRLMPEELGDIRSTILTSFQGSLKRLQRSHVTLLQLHNSITPQRGDEPTSVTPQDVLGSGGIADIFEELREQGLVHHLGLTGIGHPEALAEVVRSGRFETMQIPYHLLNPSAGQVMSDDFSETNYGNIIAECNREEMGVLAIRVLAGGALAHQPPSPHTLKTPFFPLELFQRDQQRAARIQELIGKSFPLSQVAIQFALSHPSISSALIGFGEPTQIEEALSALQQQSPPLEWDELLSTAFTEHGKS